jgi:hypothetical protein
MNGSAIFLWAALKMKLKMAVRRKVVREEGRGDRAYDGGALTPREARAFEEALDALCDAMDFRGALADAARAVSTRRDAAEAANTLLEALES